MADSKDNYRSVRLPRKMVDEIEKLTEERPELGYRSHSEYIIEALRQRLRSEGAVG